MSHSDKLWDILLYRHTSLYKSKVLQTWILLCVFKKISDVLEESPLILLVDLGKLTEKPAAHLYRQWRSILTEQVQIQPPLAGYKLLPHRAGADSKVRLHQLEDSGVHF